MLQRAAKNAYSWWWASHIRSKQSKWLDQNLHDMEEKVGYILKIIDEDGDSFARRAEMYYRKRPELLNFVEDTFRNYRALAERYDHLSRELQSANRTIATVYPERVQLAMDEEDGESFLGIGSPEPEEWNTSSNKDLPAAPKLTIPRVLSMAKKNANKPSRLMSKKGLLKFNGGDDVKPFPSSGLSKEEALEEIDDLQKQILALQTEREFVKSSYENGVKRYWDIENQISEMQGRVNSLQDEFGIGMIIEDNEARSLMTSTALKSCQETLARLQEQHEKSNEEAVVEGEKVQNLKMKFETLVETLMASQEHKPHKPQKPPSQERTHPEPPVESRKSEEQLRNTKQERIAMSELAEKVDELVEKIINLESAVLSQNAYVNRLRAEANELHQHLHRVEDEKESLIQDSENMNKKIRELEEELQKVVNLNHKINDQGNHLQTRIAEASCRLDDLSGKLINALPDEEANDTSANKSNSTVSGIQMTKENLKKDGNSVMVPSTSPKKETPLAISGDKSAEEKQMKDGNPEKGIHQYSRKVERDEPVTEDDQPNWKELFLNGLDEREKLLVEDYASVMGNYREVKNKLNEAEKKRRASHFQYVVQVKVLKNSNALKDAQIQSLQKKLSLLQENHLETPNPSENTVKDATDEPTDDAKLGHPHRQTLSELLDVSILKDSPAIEESKDREEKTSQEENKSPSAKEDEEDLTPEIPSVDEPQSLSAIEEKIRMDIDELLEENIEFWHRFSNAFQQIRKFETSVEDLHGELQNARDKAKQEGNNKPMSLFSEIRPIYRHMREVLTELMLWLENNAVHKDDLQNRLSSLSTIEDEITRLSRAGPEGEEPELGTYQAAKFQGEIQNMKQENKKVAEELQTGVERVHKLQDDITRTISKLDEEFGIKKDNNSSNRSRIPLRSFLFGVKMKKQKPSLFACVSPALQRQYSDLPYPE